MGPLMTLSMPEGPDARINGRPFTRLRDAFTFSADQREALALAETIQRVLDLPQLPVCVRWKEHDNWILVMVPTRHLKNAENVAAGWNARKHYEWSAR